MIKTTNPTQLLQLKRPLKNLVIPDDRFEKEITAKIVNTMLQMERTNQINSPMWNSQVMHLWLRLVGLNENSGT